MDDIENGDREVAREKKISLEVYEIWLWTFLLKRGEKGMSNFDSQGRNVLERRGERIKKRRGRERKRL